MTQAADNYLGRRQIQRHYTKALYLSCSNEAHQPSQGGPKKFSRAPAVSPDLIVAPQNKMSNFKIMIMILIVRLLTSTKFYNLISKYA